MSAPPFTVRARWTLMCAALAVVCGAVVLVVTLVFTDHLLHDRAPNAIGPQQPPVTGQPLPGGPPPPEPVQTQLDQGRAVTTGVISDVRRIGVLTMAAMTAVSLGLGWVVAGRMLRPVHRITDAAQSVSGARLGDRIAMVGPDDELKRLADTFDAMLDRLDAAFAAQRNLVADASHELRTPLAVMRVETEVALDDPGASPAELRAALANTLAHLESTSDLVDRLLNLSRADTLARVQDADLAESARRAIADVEALTRAPDRAAPTLHTTLAPAPVRGDRVLLDRLVANLVDNAVRHNRPGGSVWVTTSVTESRSVLTVDNDGPVVDPVEVDALFDRFQRRDDAIRRVNGVGLGLAIVAAVARTHGATVQTRARETGGLSVAVSFPSS